MLSAALSLLAATGFAWGMTAGLVASYPIEVQVQPDKKILFILPVGLAPEGISCGELIPRNNVTDSTLKAGY